MEKSSSSAAREMWALTKEEALVELVKELWEARKEGIEEARLWYEVTHLVPGYLAGVRPIDEKGISIVGKPVWPPLPSGMTRHECVEGLRVMRDMMDRAEKMKDPTHSCFPDLNALLEYTDEHGFPPPTL